MICTLRSRAIFASLNALAMSVIGFLECRGNADQFAAGRLEVRLETAAGGGNQSEPPGAADCFRNFKRSPLDPASVKLRSYLQNRQVVTFLQCSPFARFPPVSAKPMFDNGFA